MASERMNVQPEGRMGVKYENTAEEKELDSLMQNREEGISPQLSSPFCWGNCLKELKIHEEGRRLSQH